MTPRLRQRPGKMMDCETLEHIAGGRQSRQGGRRAWRTLIKQIRARFERRAAKRQLREGGQ